ncbi:MAG TPA: baseplate J/gp47 family protein [Blastocatellia bacterium]
MSANPPTINVPTTASLALIPAPVLDSFSDPQRAADLIGRVTGPLSVTLLTYYIASLQALVPLVQAGQFSDPICPELTNANPSSSHTVVLEAMVWALQQQAFMLNQVPQQNQIAFANLFPTGIRGATPAVTTVTFIVAPPVDVNVDIPAGTQVETADGSIVFTTNADLSIPYASGPLTGSVAATCTTPAAGNVLLAPNTLTVMATPLAWVASVTNASAIDSGTNAETVQSALARATAFQQRAERLVSTNDIVDAVLNEVMGGSGIVACFPFVAAGNFSTGAPGYSTVVVATAAGFALDATTLASINQLLLQLAGNQYVSVIGPIYVAFTVTATIALVSGANSQAVEAAIQANLAAFYAPSVGNFGQPILRAQIITIIEGTPGVARIVAQPEPSGPILAAPLSDTLLSPWQLPQLGTVTITVQ